MNHIKIFVSYILNCCTKKKKNSIYARIMANSKYDKYDVLNCNSSNLLRLINNLAEKKQEKDLTIYLEYFDDNRLESYLRFAKEVERNNVKLIMLKGFSKDGHLLSRYYNRLYNAFKRFSSILWLSETGDTRFDGKLKCQTEICLNYFISCKNDYIIGKDRRWEKLDVLITTALLPSHIISSTEGVHLSSCKSLGFPRNDSLIDSNKAHEIKRDLSKRIGYYPAYLFIYAPTFRDYERSSNAERYLMGYPCKELASFLLQNHAVLIYKLHPLQNMNIIQAEECMIPYEASYNWSFYDLLAASSCLIGDYSSVNLDYLLTNKPIIYNLYDYDDYIESRGLSFDPYIDFCPGERVTNETDLIKALSDVIQNNDLYQEARHRISRIMHKNQDNSSTERVIDFIQTNYLT